MERDPDQFVCQVLGRFTGFAPGRLSDLVAQDAPVTPEATGESVLGRLVRRGLVSRVAARALLLAARGEFDESDLRQLLGISSLQAALRRHVPAADFEANVQADDDAARSPRRFRLGDRVGKFIIKGLLGAGASGQVYLATHGTLGVPVALKVFSRAGRFFEQQFRDEARLLARLDHPNIVRVLDLEDGDPPYIVLEYADGDSLEAILRHRAPLDTAASFRTAVQIAAGLRAAQRAGVVHLDVKPANVLTTLGGVIKLADFGIARWRRDGGASAPAATATAVQGTWLYMAPEQFANAATFRSDMYSLGLLLYQMLSGTLPVEGATPDEVRAWHESAVAEPLHRFVPAVSVAVSSAVQRLLDKDVERRPETYDELINDLESAFGLKLSPN